MESRVVLMNSVTEMILAWISRKLPAWSKFKVAPVGKYLGFMLGPQAGAVQWNAPLDKFRQRVSDIHHSGAAVSVASYTYNFRVVHKIIVNAY